MRKGRDGEEKKWKMKKKWNGMENNGEKSGPLTSLPVDRLVRAYILAIFLFKLLLEIYLILSAPAHPFWVEWGATF